MSPKNRMYPVHSRKTSSVKSVKSTGWEAPASLEVSVALTHHRCTSTQLDMRLLYQCFLTALARLKMNEFSNCSTRAQRHQEPTPLHIASLLKLPSHAQLTAPNPSPIPHHGLEQWQMGISSRFDFISGPFSINTHFYLDFRQIKLKTTVL